jgi:hypothetical protein
MSAKKYIFILLAVLMGCTEMEDNYKQYTEETIYPGKVSRVVAKVGIEQIYLSWKSPTDPKSSRIMVKYTEKDSVITDSIVSKIVITGLTESRGYDFYICSLDDYGNKSVSTSANAKPMMRSYVENNVKPTKPTFTYSSTKATGTIKWEKLTTSIMKFAKGNYRLSIVGGNTFTGDLIEKKSVTTKGIVEISLPDVDLHGKAIQFNYTIGLLPLQSDGKPIADTVTFNVNTDKIKMIN